MSESMWATLIEQVSKCDAGPKNIQLQTANIYRAGMTKEQCIEQFISNANKYPSLYGLYELDYTVNIDGSIQFAFSDECCFRLTVDEFNSLMKRV
jgi:hypothetical protein